MKFVNVSIILYKQQYKSSLSFYVFFEFQSNQM